MSPPIELTCLGAVRLLDPSGEPVERVLAQPKRLALLAYLVLADPQATQSRDSLLGVFWPESDEESARASLRQALSFLRRELGRELVTSRGRSWIGVDCDRIVCDALVAEAHLDAGEPHAALDLYGGELLRGLEVRGCPEFDHWLSTRRAQLARRMSAAAGQLAETARDEGDARSALELARRALAIRPAGEQEVRRLMGIQLWAGDRAGALRTYERFEQWLDEELGAAPSTRTRELADRARGLAATDGSPGPADDSDLDAGEGSDTADPAASAARGTDRTGPTAGRGRARPLPAPRAGGSLRRIITTGVVVLAAVLAVGFVLRLDGTAGDASGDAGPEQVLVLPFEVHATDSSLAVLGSGMPELLGTVFNGRIGPRVVAGGPASAGGPVDAATAIERARSARAEWSLTGEVLGDRRRVHIQATLERVGGPGPALTAAVDGPSDSAYHLVRDLGERLLGLTMGESEGDAELLARTSSDAVRAYLLGRRAYSAGRFQEADERFREALRHDSLFAPAAVRLVETHLGAPWIRGHVFETALPLAFRLRDRLGSADREIVTAVAGPYHPAPSTQAEHYRAWKRAVQLAPDRASVWYRWGDALFHTGPFIGIPDSRNRAKAAFLRTLALDSTYLLPLPHLVEIAIAEGETRLARTYLDQFIGSGISPDNADQLRWRLAVAEGNEEERERLRRRFPEMEIASLRGIMTAAQFTGRGLEDAQAIADLGVIGWSTPSERSVMLETLHFYSLNRGRPTWAAQLLDAMAETSALDRHDLFLAIRDALVTGGHPAVADRAARLLQGRLDAAPSDSLAVGELCALEAWKLRRGDSSTIDASLARLQREAERLSAQRDRRPAWCATFLAAFRTLETGHGDLEEAAAAMRQLAREGVTLPGLASPLVRITAAELLERTGDVREAREINRLVQSVPRPLVPRLLREGRLSAILGDTAAAIRAYEHYLALRSDPEPSLVPQRDSVAERYRSLLGAAPDAARAPDRSR